MNDFLKNIRREPAPLTFSLDAGQTSRYYAWRKTVVGVSHAETGEELDLTDYDSW